MNRLADEPENPGLVMKCKSDVSVMISRCQVVASFHIASPDIESPARTNTICTILLMDFRVYLITVTSWNSLTSRKVCQSCKLRLLILDERIAPWHLLFSQCMSASSWKECQGLRNWSCWGQRINFSPWIYISTHICNWANLSNPTTSLQMNAIQPPGPPGVSLVVCLYPQTDKLPHRSTPRLQRIRTHAASAEAKQSFKLLRH